MRGAGAGSGDLGLKRLVWLTPGLAISRDIQSRDLAARVPRQFISDNLHLETCLKNPGFFGTGPRGLYQWRRSDFATKITYNSIFCFLPEYTYITGGKLGPDAEKVEL